MLPLKRAEATGLQERLDIFAKNFDRALLIEIQSEQSLVSMPISIVTLV